MGSSWRSNIWDLGLVDWGISICSPILDPIIQPHFVLTNYWNPPYRIIRVPPPEEPDMIYFPLPRPTGPGNFPYGIDVEPDVPV